MQDVKNIKQLLVAGDINRTSSVQALDKNLTSTYFVNGEVVITDPSGKVLSTTTAVKAVDRIFIKQRASEGDGVYPAVEIPGKAITGYYAEFYTAPKEQVSTLTNPSIFKATETTYWLKVLPVLNPNRRDTFVFSWRSGKVANPTQAQILVGLANNINLKGSYDKLLRIKAEVTYDGAVTAIVGSAVVTTGSKTVTLTSHGITVIGTLVDIDGVIYEVAAIPSVNVLTLTAPFVGASKANAVISSVTDNTDDTFNLVITGLPFIFEEGEWNYEKGKFTISLSEDFETQFITTTRASRGCGTYEEIREMEYYTKNFFGNDLKQHPIYPVKYLYDSVKTKCYDKITITWENTETRNIAGNDIQSGALVIALPVNAGQADGGTTTIEEVLNAYIVTSFGFGKAIAVS